MFYRKRIIDEIIDYYASIAGCIYIKGPRWCGKTTTASNHSKTIYNLGVARSLASFNLSYDSDPETIFSKEKPILFDEWQHAPYLWDEIRNQVDQEGGEGGNYFLTGSSEPRREVKEEYVKHSGTGRFLELTMRPMSLYESGESNGSISLLSLFDEGASITGRDSSLDVPSLIHATARGGWPRSLTEEDPSKSLKYPRLVLDRLINGSEKLDDEPDSEIYTNPRIMRRILRSYARNVSTLASHSTILKGARGSEFPNLDRKTYDAYMGKLERLYLIDEVEPWCPSFKSRAAMSASNKKCFVDPSLAISMLNLSPRKLEEDMIDYGFFFENLCMRDLRVYASKSLGELYYYHDRDGNEADAVIVLEDGRYALAECKMGFEASVKAADGLLKLKRMIEEHNASIKDKSAYMDLPSALIVIYAGKQAITLPNGVHLVPIGSLRD